MKELILVRHGHALDGTPDFDRQLNHTGVQAVNQLAYEMSEHIGQVDKVIASPAARTKQTAYILSEHWKINSSNISWQEEVYEASLDTLKEILNQIPGTANRVLLVGHNPGLSMLVHYLTGAVCHLEPSSLVHIKLYVDEWGLITQNSGSLMATHFPTL